jgi:hypothetical protein
MEHHVDELDGICWWGWWLHRLILKSKGRLAIGSSRSTTEGLLVTVAAGPVLDLDTVKIGTILAHVASHVWSCPFLMPST